MSIENSSIIFSIATRSNKGARSSIRLHVPASEAKFSGSVFEGEEVVHSSADSFATDLVALTVGQLAEKDFKGTATIIVNDSTAIRCYEALKAVKGGEPIAESLYKEWMDGTDWCDVLCNLETAVMAASEKGIGLNFVQESNLYRWNFRNEALALENYKAGDEITVTGGITEKGLSLDCGNRLTGKFTVREGLSYDGSAYLYVDRQGTSAELKMARKLTEKTWEKVPRQEEFDLDCLAVAAGEEF